MFTLVGGVLIVAGVAAAVATGRPEHRRRRGLAAVVGSAMLGCAVAPRAAELSPPPEEALVEIELQPSDALDPVPEPPKPVQLPPTPPVNPVPQPATEPQPEPPKPQPAPALPTPVHEQPPTVEKLPPMTQPPLAAKQEPPAAKKEEPLPPAAPATNGKLDMAQLVAQSIERVRRRGGHNEGVRITLVWNNTDDVDLVVGLEDGTRLQGCTPTSTSKCGGVIELDANLIEDDATNRPVEHAVWPAGARPAGKVTITARMWKRRANTAEGTRYYVIVHDEISWLPRVQTGVLKTDREEQVVDFLDFRK